MIARGMMLLVRDTIRTLNLENPSFEEVVTKLTEGDYPARISRERYAAMIINVLRGHTTDEDVLWHEVRRR